MSESWVLVSSVSGPGLSVTWLGACWGAGDGVRGAGLPPGACGGGVVGVVCGARGVWRCGFEAEVGVLCRRAGVGDVRSGGTRRGRGIGLGRVGDEGSVHETGKEDVRRVVGS